MNDLKTQLNPLIPIGRLAFALFFNSMLCYMYPVFRDSKATVFAWFVLIIVLVAYGYIFNLMTLPFIERTKKYLIKEGSIEEFNFLTSKTKSINKDDIKGFTTSEVPYRTWGDFKAIIIYLKNGTIIDISQYSYFNFKDIELTLLAKNYNYLGREKYERNFFGDRIYKYDDSNSAKKPNNTDQGIGAKIKLVFVPYLIISLATVIGWAFLHWLLSIKLNIYPVNEGVIVLVMPLVLSLISIFIWLYKKIKLPSVQSGMLAFYLLVPLYTMIGLSFFVQQYVIVGTGNMTHLSSISQMEQKEPTKFYTLKNFYLDKKHLSIKKEFSPPGKSQDLEMNLYITIPILNSVNDTLGLNCIAWYGVKYTDTAYGFMDNHNVKRPSYGTDYRFTDIDTIENSVEVKRFVNESMMQFDNLNTNQFLYLDRIARNEDDYDGYVMAIKNNTKYNPKSDVVLLPCNEPLAERANNKLIVALIVFGIGSLLFLIMVISPNLKSKDEV